MSRRSNLSRFRSLISDVDGLSHLHRFATDPTGGAEGEAGIEHAICLCPQRIVAETADAP
jgi:hypothetical protein